MEIACNVDVITTWIRSMFTVEGRCVVEDIVMVINPRNIQ